MDQNHEERITLTNPEDNECKKEPEMALDGNLDLLGKEVITLTELMKYEVNEIPFLWDKIIPKYGISFLTGPSDCNKSTFLRQLAIAIGRGESKFLELPLYATHKDVIMIITEDVAVNLRPLIAKQLAGVAPGQPIEIRFVFPSSDVVKTLNRLLTEKHTDLVIIDTWTDIFSKDLNQANDVRGSLHKLSGLVKKHGCAMLCLHHIKKGADEKAPSKDGMIGSMGIQAYARTVMEMRREHPNSNRRLLTVVKGNYTNDSLKNSPLILELNEETMQLSNTLEHRPSVSGRPKGEGRNFSPEQKEKFILRIKKLLSEGESQGSIEKTLKTEYPDEHTPSKGTINKWIQEDSGVALPEDAVSQKDSKEN